MIKFERQKDRNLIDATIFVSKDSNHGTYGAEGKDEIDALKNLCESLADALRDEIKCNNSLYSRLKRINDLVRQYDE